VNEFDDVFARLAGALRPVQVEEDIRKRMRERLRTTLATAAPSGTTTTRGEDGEWLALNPLVQIKVLRVDAEAGNQTLLLRAAPGAVLPRHRHNREEEFIILEGECHIGSLRLEAGDAHFAAAGTWHEDITTATGVLVLIRGEYPAPVYS
jgi:quercetin dioxygenase-like cupin family protein